MQGIDCMLHVNARLTNCGLAAMFNPTNSTISQTLTLPFYYTGIKQKASVQQEGGTAVIYDLDHNYNIDIMLSMAPKSITWFLIQNADV